MRPTALPQFKRPPKKGWPFRLARCLYSLDLSQRLSLRLGSGEHALCCVKAQPAGTSWNQLVPQHAPLSTTMPPFPPVSPACHRYLAQLYLSADQGGLNAHLAPAQQINIHDPAVQLAGLLALCTYAVLDLCQSALHQYLLRHAKIRTPENIDIRLC